MKMKLLTISVIGIFVLFVLVIFLSFSLKKTLAPINTSSFPTPTLMIASPLSITTVAPENGKTTTSIYPNINVIFSRNVSNNEEKTISIELSPVMGGSASWSTNNTLTFSPSQHLETDTNYTVIIKYGKSNYSWTFKTPTGTVLSDDDQLKLTAEGDAIFNDGIKKLHETYPWYDTLPIITPDYFIGFSPGQDMFYIDVYTDISSTVPVNNQVATFKKQALDSLTKTGVNLSKFTITWGVFPK